MKSKKEIILNNLNFWNLERRWDNFIFCSNGFKLEDGDLIKEIQLEKEEDFQEFKKLKGRL